MATEYKLSYTGSEINQKLAKIDSLAQKSEVPTKTSDLTNDSGFITGYTETDPTVPSWAKQPTKPTYTASEVGLGNVENKSSATIRDELTKDNVTTALGYTPPTQDTIYTHPTTSGNKHIPSGGSSGQILKWSSDGTAVWGDVEWSGGSTESGGGLPPLRIYAVKNGVGYTQEIVEGGATQAYTAAEIHEIAKQRVVTIETYTSRDTSKGQGVHQYYRTDFAANGTVNQVVFRGVYLNDTYKTVPSYVTINQLKNVFVSDEEWSGGSVETDATLTQNGYPANAKTVGDRLTALSEQIANSSGGGTSIDVTADIGQTIVVKEVDANGKPTAWESADYQPRTHWSEFGTVTIMPETTIEIDPETGGGAAPVDFVLEPNKAYTIKYNGVEYPDCVGTQVEVGLAFGNLGAAEEGFPITEHPFVLVFGEFNGERGVMAVPLDGSETVTVSIEGESEIAHKIPKKYVPTLEEMRSEVVEILPETTIPIDLDGGENMIPVNFVLELNKAYTIKYNGVEYPDCVGVRMSEVAVGFGNLSAIDESFPATNHPFILGSGASDMDGDGNVDYTIAVMPLDGSESVTLSILDEKVHKIPVKYLPDSVPYSETNLTEILPETTIEIDPDSGEGYYTEAIGLSVGKNYTVRWNGIEYNCTAQDFYTPIDEEGNTANVGVFVGNLGIMMDGEGTGEPFIIADISSEFVAESGVPVTIFAFDGSESVTLSIAEQTEIIHKLDGKCLPDGMPYSEMGLAELMPETTLVTNDNETYHYAKPIGLVAGRIYTVKLNGMPLSCIAQDAINEGGERLGVMLAVDQQPFLIEIAPEYVELMGGDYHVVITLLNAPESITVSVLGESEIIHKLDGKYLPDSVGYEEIVPFVPTKQFDSYDASNGFIRFDYPDVKFIEGSTYIVNWNGVKYTCVAGSLELENYIGNRDKQVGNGDTGEPFVVYDGLLVYPLDGTTTEGTISIDQVVIHKIPEKYLPDIGGNVPTKTSQLENDSGFITADDIPEGAILSVNGKTGVVNLNATDVGAEVAGTVSAHNTADDSHNDIRLLIEGLTTRLNTLANSTDEDLNQMAEIVAYIKNNKSLIESITTSKVNVADIVNNLTTNAANRPLSAAQGVAIKKLIDDLQTSLSSYAKTADLGTLATKDTIAKTDLATAVQTSLNKADTALQSYTETDPTVPAWAKTASKPTYTKSEVGLGNVENVKQYSASNPPPYPVTKVNNKTGAVTLTATDVGLGNVNNTSDANKPISTAQQTALDAKLDKANPVATGSFSLGRKDGSRVSSNSFAVGNNVEASGFCSHAEGSDTIASSDSSHAEGYGATASNDYSHAEGCLTTASGLGSHAEGYGATASGQSSHAEGCSTARGQSSHAEGCSTAIGDYSHAEGSNRVNITIAITGDANALTYTTASAYSRKLGEVISYTNPNTSVRTYAKITAIDTTNNTITLDKTLASEALDNVSVKIYYGIAYSDSSHAEGHNTIASGDTSHAEGHNTIASGDTSHAEGKYTTAIGDCSHAEGAGTDAQCKSQHVQGEFNVLDTEGNATTRGKYAHIVGNGADAYSRSNAHTLDWNGTAWFAGGIKVGGTSQDDIDAKEVALKSDIDDYVFITIDDIDEICGTTLLNAEELAF